MTKINIKALRIIALCVVLLLVSGFILFEVAAGQEKKERQKREVEPALAPVSIMYPDVFKPSETDDDISYSLSSSGSFIIKDRTRNSDYVITPEGDVYRLLEDGSMTEVDKEEEKRIIAVATPIINDDPIVGSIFANTPKGAISQIKEEMLPEKATDNSSNSQTVEDVPVPSTTVMASNTNPAPSITGTAMKEMTLPGIKANIEGSAISNSVSKNSSSSSNSSSTGPYESTAALAAAIASQSKTQTSYETQNMQDSKKSFMSSFSSSSGSSQLTTNDLASGTVINMTLITGLNSDLPGQIVAQVSQNVYDTLTGTVLLIPKGTRLIATYDSSVSWGQSRALVAWTQMVRPDGFVLKLPGLPGIDAQGYSGYQDKVDNHFWSMLGAAMLASLLDLTVDEVIIQSQNAGVSNAGLTAIDSFTGTVQTAGQKYLSKVIERQPTLRVRPGRKISLLVTDTLTLTPYKEVNR